MADARDTLLLAFDKGLASHPAQGSRWLFLNAQPLPPAGRELVPLLACEQGFRPHFLSLQKAGYDVEPSRAGEAGFAGAMFMLSRSRQLNEVMLSRAWDSAEPGGMIVVAGENNDGAKSLRKYVARHCGAAESISKHHAIAFAFQRTDAANPFPQQTKPRRGGYEILPGMFSADGPDEGSSLLAAHFNDRIDGDVADFGAGWGYLGTQLLQTAFRIDAFDSIEADFASLQAAQTNLEGLAGETRMGFHWLDLTKEALPAQYDWIVMNPPFHDGRAAVPALGAAFIAAAASALKSGGTLLMVANRNLPYEAPLARHFKTVQVLEDNGSFKIVEARR
jgi:16S rRNA (guanine1207-N2)-methyltransferase